MTTKPKCIRVGDQVKVANHRRSYLTTIERETKTQWVAADGNKYNKRTRRLVGERDAWTHTTIRAVTADEAAEIKDKNAQRACANYLSKVNWWSVDLGTLRAIIQLVKNASQ